MVQANKSTVTELLDFGDDCDLNPGATFSTKTALSGRLPVANEFSGVP
jgi:hypothetical protein